MQGSFEAPKRSEDEKKSLQAPWDEITRPGFDKKTHDAMRRHYAKDEEYKEDEHGGGFGVYGYKAAALVRGPG
jgi:hypothetical protein